MCVSGVYYTVHDGDDVAHYRVRDKYVCIIR